MLQRILVPLDGSPLSERAIPYATSLARASGARIILLRAVEAHALTGRGRAKARVAAMTETETYLDEIADSLHEHDLTIDVALPYGDAAEAIADEVARRAVDLVVMATHGRSGLGRIVYGSVAERVLHEAEVPVLLVRAWDERPGGSFDAAPRIIVPLDGSRFAEAALPVARDLAVTLGGQLLLVRAVAPPDIAMASAMTYVVFDPEEELAAATAYLLAIVAENPDGPPTQVLAQVGTPVYIVAEVARANDAALIVMATHGRGGLGRMILGSVADATLRQGTTPLLLVHPHEDETSEATASIAVAASR